MSWFLLLLPLILIVSSILIYRFVGRGEVLHFDIVQFFYAFVFTPMAFVWMKVLLYLLLKNNFANGTSDLNYLMIDSVFSLIFLYIFGFEMLHGLTKTVSLNVSKDPLYDIFHYLEYFHLWMTHLVVFGGGITTITILGLANLFFPLDLTMTKLNFYLILLSGLVVGGLIFMGIWLSDPKQEKGYHFMRIMKALIGILFLIHTIGYFLAQPKLTPDYLVYWWSAISFTIMVMAAFVSYKSNRARNWIERLSDKLKHPGFEFRLQIK